MHDIREKTKEGNIKNMSIFHDWTSHKKPCDHQWSYSSVLAKKAYLKKIVSDSYVIILKITFFGLNCFGLNYTKIVSKGSIR